MTAAGLENHIGIHEADTLIRAVLHMNPDKMDDETWLHYTCQAVWMEDYRVSRIAKLFSKD